MEVGADIRGYRKSLLHAAPRTPAQKKMMEVAMKSSSMFYRRECRPRNECGGEYQKGILVSIGVYRLELCALTGRAARRRL